MGSSRKAAARAQRHGDGARQGAHAEEGNPRLVSRERLSPSSQGSQVTARPGAYAVPGISHGGGVGGATASASSGTSQTARSAAQTTRATMVRYVAQSTSGSLPGGDMGSNILGQPNGAARPGAIPATSRTASRIVEKKLRHASMEANFGIEDRCVEPPEAVSRTPSDQVVLDDFVATKTALSRASYPGVQHGGSSDFNDNSDDLFLDEYTPPFGSKTVVGSASPQESTLDANAKGTIPGANMGNNYASKSKGPDEENAPQGDSGGMAIAHAVDEDEDGYLPKAVQFDPDAQPSISGLASIHKDRRFGLYALLASSVVVLVAVGVVLTFILTEKRVDPADIPYRETLGILERVEYIIGSDKLSDMDSPYYRALKWITHNDPIQVLPEDPAFMQRFLAAYLYYATTTQHPWTSCNPREEGEDESCIHYSKWPTKNSWNTVQLTRWLSSHPVCYWAGVVCDGTMEIVGFELNGSNMTGHFPEGVKHFPFLRTLFFAQGKLTGPLPAEIAAMKHIAKITFHQNSFTGTIPSELWLSRGLHHISVGYNSLTGSLPPEIGKLRDAKALFLEDSIHGQIPTDMFDLKSLSSLVLDDNGIVGTIPTKFGSFASMRRLSLSKNEFSGSIPSELGQLSELEKLYVDHNVLLGGTIPDEFYSLNLKLLDLSNCNFTGTLSPKINNFTKLGWFRLRDNSFSGELPTELGELNKITELWMDGNNFIGTMPSEVCMLRSNYGLKELHADCLQDDITGEVMLECMSPCCTRCCSNSVCREDLR